MLNYTKINFIKTICGNPTLLFKMEIRHVYTEANVCVKYKTKNKLASHFCVTFFVASHF